MTFHDTNTDDIRLVLERIGKLYPEFDKLDLPDYGAGLAVLRPPSPPDSLNHMPWDYLQSPVLLVRQRMAAHFLRDCRSILEIGAFKTPITGFLTHQPEEVVIIDPLVEPYESDELNGHPCRVRHLASALNDLDLLEWRSKRFGMLFCGMDLDRQHDEPGPWLETVCRFVYLVSQAQPPVLEYPVQWQPSAQIFHLILSLLQPRIAADVRLDLTRFPDDQEVTDEIRTRFERRMVVLADMNTLSGPDEVRERAARILFGSQAGPLIAGTSSRTFQPIPDGLALQQAQIHNGAQVQFRKGELHVQTRPEAWSYAAMVPLSQGVLFRLKGGESAPATVEIELAVDQGELGLGMVGPDLQNIVGERLVRAAGQPQTIKLFVPDLRPQIGLICRNGQLERTVCKARILRLTLALPE